MKYERTLGFYDSKRLGDILFIFHKNHNKYLNDRLSEYGLSLIQALCILMIHERDGLNQKDLAQGLHLTKGAITKSIKKLEKEGWILREKSLKDKRNNVLKLSKKGEDFIPIIFEINDDWETKMGLSELNSEFMDTITELTLKSIDLNLKKE